ncbi:MAG: hypothetical protein IKG00_00100 [Lachnospiraceae bacterium]|nr:hypothetical protein [Lachnospiraceae bacterium]
MIKGFMNFAVVQSFRAGHDRDGEAMIFALFHSKKSAESCARHMNRINVFPSAFSVVALPCKVESGIYDPAMFYENGEFSGDCIADQKAEGVKVDLQSYEEAMKDVSGSRR